MTAEEPLPPAPTPENGTGAPSAPASDEQRAPTNAPPSPRRRFAALAVGVLVVAGAVWYFAIRAPEPRDDLGRFQGEWKLTTAGREKQFPITVRVTGATWVYLVGDKDQKRYSLTLRPDTDPKEIDLTQLAPDGQPQMELRDGKFVPVVHRGVYTIAGDTAKLVTAPNPIPRPTSFDATDGAPVWVLERQGR